MGLTRSEAVKRKIEDTKEYWDFLRELLENKNECSNKNIKKF